jgi:hypothetical protein
MHVHAKAFVASTAVTACMLTGLAGRCAAQSAASVAGQVSIPPELPDAAEFVAMLQRAGVVVNQVRPGAAKLTLDGEAAVIFTNRGVVEVEILKGEMDAESITVTYSKNSYSKNSDYQMLHNYEFSRPKGNKIGYAVSATPLYFTLHNRWFIKTYSAQLDVLIKEALGQANSLNR